MTTTELVYLQADGAPELRRRAEDLAAGCATSADRPLVDLVGDLPDEPVSADHRLAVVATSVPDLERQLRRFVDGGGRSGPAHGAARRSATYTGDVPVGQHGRVAWLFPGEGGQYAGMLTDLCVLFPGARACFDLLDRAAEGGTPPSRSIFPVSDPGTGSGTASDGEGPLWRMGGAVEAVFTANRAVSAVLRELGTGPDVVVGHSTGEYSALLEAGALDLGEHGLLEQLRLGSRLSRQLDTESAVPEGGLLAVALVDIDTITEVLRRHEGRAWLALDNCPSQLVVFAVPSALPAVGEDLRRAGALVQPLPFGRAYHTPLFEPVVGKLAPLLDQLPFRAPATEVWSSSTAAPYPSEPEQIRRILAAQWASTVRFRQTVLGLHENGVRVFVEAGPRGNLRQFVADTLRDLPHLAVAADHHQVPGLTQLQHLVAALAAAGVRVDLGPLRPARQPQPERTPPRLALGLPAMSLVGGPPARTASPDADPSVRTGVRPPGRPAPRRAAPRRAVPPRAGPRRAVPRPAPPRPARAESWSGVEVLDPARDRWLRDHALGGPVSAADPELTALIVVPFTVSLELLARAAVAFRPGSRVRALRDVRAFRWLVVDDLAPAPLALSLAATSGPGADDVRVVVTERDRPDRGPAVEGVVELGDPPPATLGEPLALLDGVASTWRPDELYRYGMFHGPAFRGVRSIDAVGGVGLLATITVAAELPGPAPLTAPLHIDAGGQLVGFWTAARLPNRFAVFPRAVGRVQLAAEGLPTGQLLAAGLRVRSVTDETVVADFEVQDPTRRRLLAVTGWEDTRARIPAGLMRLRVDPARALLSEDWPALSACDGRLTCRRVRLDERLADDDAGIWLEVLASLVLGRDERREWCDRRTSRRAVDWLAGRVAAKDAARAAGGPVTLGTLPADVTVRTDERGAPRISGPGPLVSITHTGGWAVAAAATEGRGVGVDLELLSRMPPSLGDAVVDLDETEVAGLGTLGGDRALRLWCAKEAAAKALGHGLPAGPASMRVTAADAKVEELELVAGPALEAVDPGVRGERVSVRTARDGDLVAAIALR